MTQARAEGQAESPKGESGWKRPGVGVELLDGAVVEAAWVTGVRLHSVGGAPPRYQVDLHYSGEWVGFFQSRHRERAEWEFERLKGEIFTDVLTPPEADGPVGVAAEARAEAAMEEPREGVPMANPYRVVR